MGKVAEGEPGTGPACAWDAGDRASGAAPAAMEPGPGQGPPPPP